MANEKPTDAPPAGGKFAPGQSGNPAGRPPGVPNKATTEVKEWARAIFDDPLVRQKTLALAQTGKLPPGIFTELLHYAYGRPATTIDLGPRAAVSIAKLLAGDFTDEDT